VRDEAIDKLKGALENMKTRVRDLEAVAEEARQQAREATDSVGADRTRTSEVLQRTRKALEVAQKLLS